MSGLSTVVAVAVEPAGLVHVHRVRVLRGGSRRAREVVVPRVTSVARASSACVNSGRAQTLVDLSYPVDIIVESQSCQQTFI